MNHKMKVISKFFQFAPILLLVLVSACAPAATPTAEPATEVAPVPQDNVVNVYNWSDYMDESILADFEEKFGVTVNYTEYGGMDDLIDVLEAGPVDYDLVVPADYAVEYLRNESMFGAPDRANMPNFGNIAPTFINPYFDPGNRYCIPYQWGTTGIGYNIQATGKEILGWGDVFDLAVEGRVRLSLLADPRESLGAVLLFLGYSPNTTNPVEINEAAEFLKAHADQIVSYAPDTGSELLAAGELDIAHDYSGDIFQHMENNPDIRYVIPSEGAIIWSDNVCLLANAPHKENAEMFMNYLLDPEVGAALSNYLRYATPNQAALPLINESDRNDPGLYPSEDVLSKLFFLTDVGEATQVYEDAWSEILANHAE
ncbi:MAG: spermidine/putrescine ABC transporter substrate-binding protein [Anaerolineae bacterium]|nr:spermidine/putrescine ABC transporter substrate-binding protein [Anaerolineae bacterium]